HILGGQAADGSSRAGITLENELGNKFFLNTWYDQNRFSIGRLGVADDFIIGSSGNIGIGGEPGGNERVHIQVRTLPPGAPNRGLVISNPAGNGVVRIYGDTGKTQIGEFAFWSGAQMLSVSDPTQDWQIRAWKTVSARDALILLGADESTAHIQGWSFPIGGPVGGVPNPLVLQPNGGYVRTGFLYLADNGPNGAGLLYYPNTGATAGLYIRSDDDPSTFEAASERMVILPNGNVGIGTVTPDPYRLYVNGNQFISGTLSFSGGFEMPDVAENMDCAECEPGDVVVVDPAADHRLTRSTHAYDHTLAGVISESPTLHIGGSRSETAKPLALAGQVRCKVTTENGPIRRGDLLVSASTPGHAMRADPDEVKPGTLIGKALEPLAEGQGTIRVLITGG
ncbi:MAG: hypothetical protein HYY58_05475, partial [Candidatus Omnitrophica bacterium]|nr:hypothetical protein [Candidatus Omnitrophota bacterium]